MESKYTPGPWRLEIIRQPSGYLYRVMGTCADEQEGNTALINAAPELLAALIGLEDALGCLLESGRIETRNDAPIIAGKLEEAQAAIARAESE